MIPLLSLGIPGTASTAVMLAALLLYGFQPGPLLFTDHPEIGWPVIASLYIGNVMLLILNLPMIPVWVRILKIPYWALYPAILVLAVVGVYSVRSSMTDVYMMVGFGLLGYVFGKFGCRRRRCSWRSCLGRWRRTRCASRWCCRTTTRSSSWNGPSRQP
jgi:putative tricarboxylic transport membrane protein